MIGASQTREMGGLGTWRPAGCTCDPTYHQRHRSDGKLTACFFGDVGHGRLQASIVAQRQRCSRKLGTALRHHDVVEGMQGRPIRAGSQSRTVRLTAFGSWPSPCDGREMWRGANQWMWSNQAGCSGGGPVRTKTSKGTFAGWDGTEEMDTEDLDGTEARRAAEKGTS